MASRAMIRRFLWPALLLLGGAILLLADIPPVSLSWETASEVGTAGFNVSRADSPDGPFAQINATLIPAQGSEITGATYHFVDEHTAPLHRYVYRIEEVEWNGTITPYPETITVRAGFPRSWTKAEGGILLLLAVGLTWQELHNVQKGDSDDS